MGAHWDSSGTLLGQVLLGQVVLSHNLISAGARAHNVFRSKNCTAKSINTSTTSSTTTAAEKMPGEAASTRPPPLGPWKLGNGAPHHLHFYLNCPEEKQKQMIAREQIFQSHADALTQSVKDGCEIVKQVGASSDAQRKCLDGMLFSGRISHEQHKAIKKELGL